MTGNGLVQLLLTMAAVLLCVKPLGGYMATVFAGERCILSGVLQPIEAMLYRCCGIKPDEQMNWKHYLWAMLWFNLLGLLFLYGIQRLQSYSPLNPEHMPNIPPALAFNTAISFVTNTNWQAYSGEETLSYFTQMFGLTVQNFLSAATGMALLMALVRGIMQRENAQLGNFWVDATRGVLYILLPLSFVLAIVLVSQGVIQNFKPYQTASLIQPVYYAEMSSEESHTEGIAVKKVPSVEKKWIFEQTIPMGPVASQVAIKQLGSNGGGFFNSNAAHPFENPKPLTNFLECLAILLIPAALCYTFGVMVQDKRQGWALLWAMFLIWVPCTLVTLSAEQAGYPELSSLGVEQSSNPQYPGGNMEGKETRFGITQSAIWATATTATANGSVNAMHGSLTPMGGLVVLWLIHLGEVVFGGVGSGLYGMLMFVILTVFMAGLMIGRTPEYLGKKIEPFEMKMAVVSVLVLPLLVLLNTAIAVLTPAALNALGNPGSHGFTEIMYAFSSMVGNNGSAFAGLNADTPFYNCLGGVAMLFGRYWMAIPALALAGSLARKKIIPTSAGTLPTHTFVFVSLLVGVILLIGALSFLPALALGPIAEYLSLIPF